MEKFTKPETNNTTKTKHKAKTEKSPLVENRAKDSKKKVSNKNSKEIEAKTVEKKENENIAFENAEETEVLTKTVKKSLSPQKTKIKEETITPDTKKGPKNVMSFFIKKDVNGSEGEGKESGIVTGRDSHHCNNNLFRTNKTTTKFKKNLVK